MRKVKVPYSVTGRFSGIITDYLADAPHLKSFYRYRPELAAFADAIKERQSVPVDRKVLTQALTTQYQNGAPELAAYVAGVLQSLNKPNTFTITTGHQLNLYTGPLYAVYKIATAIKLAKQLSEAYPEYSFVPVFWMASEDHDFDEISQVNIGTSSLKWNPGYPPVACGTIRTDSMDGFTAEVCAAAGDTPLFRELNDCYLASSDLAQATRRMVHKLFSRSELLVIDGNDVLLKGLFVKEMLDDAFAHNAFLKVSATAEKLGEHYKVQVSPREINLFYLEKYNRGRIIAHPEKGFEVSGSGKSFTAESLEAEIREHPDRFSPNVVMRPLFQEKILPNIAYIGGPGELAYWLELESMFVHYKVSYPVLMPRCSFMYVDPSVIRKMRKTGMVASDLFLDREELLRKLLKGTSSLQDALKSASEALNTVYSGLNREVEGIDPTLVGSLEAEKQKSLKGLLSLEEKLLRAIKRKEESTIAQIDSILEKLFPGGSLQERHQNIMAVTADTAFAESLIEICDPFSLTFDILLPDE